MPEVVLARCCQLAHSTGIGTTSRLGLRSNAAWRPEAYGALTAVIIFLVWWWRRSWRFCSAPELNAEIEHRSPCELACPAYMGLLVVPCGARKFDEDEAARAEQSSRMDERWRGR